MGKKLYTYAVLAFVLAMTFFAAVFVLLVEASGQTIRFQWPWMFGLLLLLPLVAWVRFYRLGKMKGSFEHSYASWSNAIPRGFVARSSRLPDCLRIAALALLVCALARPHSMKAAEQGVEGIDIMIALDLSQSMEEEDLARSRLDAGQRTLRQFLRKREGYGDRIGLVVFGEEAMIESPLTLDYSVLDFMLSRFKIGDVPEKGTAIGDAIGLCLALLVRSDASSKVIILLSDGESNSQQELDPVQAQWMAKELGIRVFTLLLGKNDLDKTTPLQAKHLKSKGLLQGIAEETGGLYFSAQSSDLLNQNFETIRSELDKTEFELVGGVRDRSLFKGLTLLALLLLGIELFLRKTRWRQFP